MKRNEIKCGMTKSNEMEHQAGRRGKPKENKPTFSSFINTKGSVDEMNEESFVFLRRLRLF